MSTLWLHADHVMAHFSPLVAPAEGNYSFDFYHHRLIWPVFGAINRMCSLRSGFFHSTYCILFVSMLLS